jgi:iron complex outermembrane receptor protein
MKRLQVLKSALVGGASVVALVQPVVAREFDIPDGDLSAALVAYMKQSDVELVYADNVVRGHKSRGAKGEYTETAALNQILQGTGFMVQSVSSSAIGIVPQAPAPVKVAQAEKKPAPTAPSIETVVVTAQHKSESIQQVPIAITALSQQQLTERQIAGGPDLVKEVPNLTFSKTNFTGYNLEIRGIGTQAISVTTDPAVAVAFNDIPFIRNHFFEQEFYDLQDVEVLRGPQGTLYGRNATAGVVNIKSALPTDQYEAMMSADLGNYSNRRLEGMLNLPIDGDTLDIRFAGEWTRRDGYTENTTLNSPIDGRDLWSGRLTIGWKPASNVQTYLVWEHFSEDDDRLRSGKQLCKTAPIPTEVDGVGVGGGGGHTAPGNYLSQGCEDTSLYSPSAFEVPNGYSLTYYAPLADGGAPTQPNFNVYAETTQSPNLRDIQSAINPAYRAKNDTLEWNTNWQITPALTFTSQTGYNNDFLWSMEDYNRFDSAPGAFTFGDPSVNTGVNITTPDPNGLGICGAAGFGCSGAPGTVCKAGSTDCTQDGIFCDPQLGCSDRLVLEDLSEERAWQFSQEFRLASNFTGPLNFSFGANYLHYATEENYYVFVNALTVLEESLVVNPIPGSTSCLIGGLRTVNPTVPRGVIGACGYVDPNPISSLNNEGHNYFLSQNPYMLNSYASFGEAYYNIASDLKLTAGLRWTEDQKHFVDIPSEVVVPGYGYAVTNVVDQQWDALTGRAVLNWTPQLDFTDQTLIYASAAHGYKAGGANPPGANYPVIDLAAGSGLVLDPLHPLTFKPEYIQAFELGTKNTALGNALTINADMFYYNYTGYQISEIEDRTAINNNYNAHVEGAEFEANWEPLPGLKFSLAQGFENTALAGGSENVDLMDRTAGNPDWIVVRPYPTTASNCILPTYVVAQALQGNIYGASFYDLCNLAYGAHIDPVTGLPYVPNPTISAGSNSIPAGYPGFNPATAPNNGGGFDKNLGGNQLPNAPHFTTSLTGEYTMSVSEDWAATLHADFYWQSQQWARVFEDAIDKIHGYSTTNVSLILTSANGWQVMGYVKNVFDVTAITGTFLNSDDSGLTTNVFLTDPRLYGVRVTKQLDQNDGFWGSGYSGYDFFTNLFSDTDNGKPPLWIELGGSFSNLSDAMQTFDPAFVSTYAPNGVKSPLPLEDAPHYGFDEQAKISFQPDDSDWVFSGAIRFGRSGASRRLHQQTANPAARVHITQYNGFHFPPTLVSRYLSYNLYPAAHVKFADTQVKQSESHAIMDFLVGKDVGLGMFGLDGSSIVGGGVRAAQFSSRSSIDLHGEPDVRYPSTPLITSFAQIDTYEGSKIRFHDYAASANSKESFHGLGPKLDWNASTPVAGNEQNGELTFDWGANFAVLFGRQKASGSHQTATKSYYLNQFRGGFKTGGGRKPGNWVNTALPSHLGVVPPTAQRSHATAHRRSRMVAVPNLGGFLGISMKYNNAKVSFGYRADEFFGAMDGGIDTHRSENVGFFGPFANISIGLGG